jgi:hypothetical protein
MPTSLVYELILNLAEAGEFEKATALFHNRFFQREEGGTNVRQVWLEVRIQQAISESRSGRCSEAIHIADHLAEPAPDLVFTHDGLEPFLRSARFSYLLGNVYKTCNLPDKARDHFKQAAQKWDFQDAVWAWKASRQLAGANAGEVRQQVESILERARSGENSSSNGWWLYNAAMLDSALANTQHAQAGFREALLSPDSLMTYHLTRLGMSDDELQAEQNR